MGRITLTEVHHDDGSVSHILPPGALDPWFSWRSFSTPSQSPSEDTISEEEYPAREQRPEWASIFMDMAKAVSQRSTCRRAQVGCVITSVDNLRVLGIGYNGSYAGGPNDCVDPTIPGGCGCYIHAEVNALLKCDNSIRDKVAYVTHAPCAPCASALVNAGVSKVVYDNAYRHSAGIDILKAVDIPCEPLVR